MISTLQKLAGIGTTIVDQSKANINFNANLPISIEVLKQLELGRFKLKLGRKELTTKSQKNLKEGKKYWGNFFQGQGGILTISNLCIQPEIFQSHDSFLPEEALIFFESMAQESGKLKDFLLYQLSEAPLDKEQFTIFSSMLLALKKGVVHLPFLKEGKKTLLQFHSINQTTLEFYAAFENIGPLEGLLERTNTNFELTLHASYDKSLFYLQKELDKLGIITKLSLHKEIVPLYDTNDLTLDLKG